MSATVTTCGNLVFFKLLLRFHTELVYTILVRQDKSDIELAREEAQSQNTTLRERFRDWLKWIAGRIRARKYWALMKKLRYADAGRKFTRDEMNERR
jgi:hypothetical protein